MLAQYMKASVTLYLPMVNFSDIIYSYMLKNDHGLLRTCEFFFCLVSCHSEMTLEED